MNSDLRSSLINIAKERIPSTDVSHDLSHTMRVLSNAEKIASGESGDLDVLVPAALFHDLITYPKNHPLRSKSQEESAIEAEKILLSFSEFPNDKISAVKICILECSFSKGIVPTLLESKILQDSDGLEATGAISIMRTFSSAGQMQNLFYNPQDPFCKNRTPDPFKYALDLFYERLLVVKSRMHTETAKKIAQRRTAFLHSFLDELKTELSE